MKKSMGIILIGLLSFCLIGFFNEVSADIVQIDDSYSYYEDLDFIQSSLGSQHSSVLTSEGRVFTWGYNSNGQLGDGTTTQRNIPTEITNNFNLNTGEIILSTSLGATHSSAITSEGRVFTWGWNYRGKLGDGTETQRNNPTEITSNFNLNTGETITSIFLGGNHSSAITSEGRVFIWGNNDYGQLGDGTVSYRTTPTDITSNFNLNTGETITNISLGCDHSSAITSEGRVFVWGYNYSGQLGDGTTTDKHTPTEIMGNFNLNTGEIITSISLGFDYSSAITSEGRVFVWGYNYYAQLGDGTTISRNTPTEITSNFSLNTGETITSISLKYRHSSAITSEGRVFTWGYNNYGQLGDGTTTQRNNPTEITSNFNLNTEEIIISTSLGDAHSSAITSEGRVFTWGHNYRAQLGDETTIDKSTPTEIASSFSRIKIINNYKLNPGETITSSALGYFHSSAITSEGRVFTWGFNYNGQLGDGTTTSRNTLTEITNNFDLNIGETITGISLGNFYSSAISSEGRIFMWGSNYGKQLGDGTNIDRYTPTDITSNFNLNIGETITSITLGCDHSSATTSEGRIFTWGSNGWGQLGNGTISYENAPLDITSNFNLNTGEKIINTALGQSYSSAITSEGRIFTWGSNGIGQLGDGTTTNSNTPIDITSNFNLNVGETITSLSSGAAHLSVVTSEERIFAWGYNGNGQLGDGTTTSRNTPVEITSNFNLNTGETITSIALGFYHSSAITSEGRMFTWGSNRYGQLGDGTTTGSYVNSTPTEITSNFNLNTEETITYISLKYYHSSAITSEGRIFTWGSNDNGQLGDGTNTQRNIPTEINLEIPEVNNILRTYMEDEANGRKNTIKLSIFPEYDFGNELDTITINGVDYGSTDFDVTFGRINVYIPNIWNIGDTVSLSIDSFTFIDDQIMIPIGDLEASTILIEDTIAPTFDEILEQTIEAGVSDIDWTTFIINEADNTGGVLSKVEVEDNVDYDTPGTYTVIIKVLDESLNETSQTFNVIVEDTTAPTFELSYLIVEVGSAYITWEDYVINGNDNSDSTLVFEEVNDGLNYLVLGIYQVSIKGIDESGNEAIIIFDVTVADTIVPVITLTGDSTVYVEYEDAYTEDGATFTDNYDPDGDAIIGGDTVDPSVLGTYTVTYNITDTNSNVAVELTRTVIVQDTLVPVITLTGDETVYVEYGDTYTEDGATFTDNYDASGDAIIGGDTVDSSTLGTYTVTYNITDSEGNIALEATRTVIVQDTTAPTVSLNPSLDSIIIGDEYIDYGVDASDYGTITTVVEATVDVSTAGIYILTYIVTDESGNETLLVRYITVSDIPTVEFILGNAPSSIKVGDTYTDGTCEVLINGISNSCTVKSNTVDTSVEGIYIITYSYTYLEIEYTYDRYIYVYVEGTQLTLYYRKEEELM